MLEYGEEILILDCGVMFPEADMLGVDLVLPDVTYLREKTDKIKGILLTHGHEDHIGAVPHLSADLGFPPVYATRLTHGILGNKLKEHRLLDKVNQITINDKDTFQVGQFTIEPFHIAHSIPDAVGFAITCAGGLVVYLTDWKLDHTPVDGKPTDLVKLAELGQRKPLALITDCVRVESKGYTPSETSVGEAFDNIFAVAPGRVIVATFASNISRVQQVIESAEAYGRKVLLVGRSMENNTRIALEMGFLHASEGTLIRPHEMNAYPDDQVAVVCTGSQGEPMAALNRMANRDYPHVKVKQGDTVVVSATPIPGNEVSVSRVINNLFRLGAEVIYGNQAQVHVSGHAAQEELKLVLALLRPDYVVPFHGDYRHVMLYRKLATSLNDLYTDDKVLIAEGGSIMEFAPGFGKIVGKAARRLHLCGRHDGGGRGQRGGARPPDACQGRHADRGGQHRRHHRRAGGRARRGLARLRLHAPEPGPDRVDQGHCALGPDHQEWRRLHPGRQPVHQPQDQGRGRRVPLPRDEAPAHGAPRRHGGVAKDPTVSRKKASFAGFFARHKNILGI